MTINTNIQEEMGQDMMIDMMIDMADEITAAAGGVHHRGKDITEAEIADIEK